MNTTAKVYQEATADARIAARAAAAPAPAKPRSGWSNAGARRNGRTRQYDGDYAYAGDEARYDQQ